MFGDCGGPDVSESASAWNLRWRPLAAAPLPKGAPQLCGLGHLPTVSEPHSLVCKVEAAAMPS